MDTPGPSFDKEYLQRELESSSALVFDWVTPLAVVPLEVSFENESFSGLFLVDGKLNVPVNAFNILLRRPLDVRLGILIRAMFINDVLFSKSDVVLDYDAIGVGNNSLRPRSYENQA
mmetsp:Transcript_8096/g.12404  ORF Transcript_8096/g.12404 Transcript_8096/m.12404 type:complete len:117 (-) Transcript_8096:80-430(-)